MVNSYELVFYVKNFLYDSCFLGCRWMQLGMVCSRDLETLFESTCQQASEVNLRILAKKLL
jgi:hypothetical protein